MGNIGTGAKALAKRILALSPYRIIKGAPNRFDAIEDCLRHLASSSFEPRLIVDAGAHLGKFSMMAHKVFPSAAIHMIEPQPSCAETLQRLLSHPRFFFHPVAVTSHAGTVQMVTHHEGDTGAHIAWADNRHEANLSVQGTTLDKLFNARCDRDDRALLKLDLQGHEMVALQGASKLLPKLEIVLLEVSFFQQLGEPTIQEIVRFFDAAEFDLFDVAALSARTRDDRLRQGDFVFIRRNTPLWLDRAWH